MQSLTDAGHLLTFYFEAGANYASQAGLELVILLLLRPGYLE